MRDFGRDNLRDFCIGNSMAINGRTKGASGEREAAKLLESWTKEWGYEEKVSDLECFLCREPRMESVTSCWRLDEEELAEVARTGVVWVRTLGHRVAPMMVKRRSAGYR